MHLQGIQDLLSQVEKPSRYLGTEVNRIEKMPESVRLHMALCFPDLYEIGSSHFGVQILYHLLNQKEDIYAERVFAPGLDMVAHLKRSNRPLFSLETRTPLGDFDIIGFSLLYELNYTNVLNMIHLAGLPLRASDRNENQPLVIAGGPCVSNPEPMAPFFDVMVFGDGEGIVLEIAEKWMHWKTQGASKKDLLQDLAQLEGIYIPSFFHSFSDMGGFQRLTPTRVGYERVKRIILADLEKAFFPEKPIIPFGKPIHDRLRLEISRGCSRGCRFCQAGMIYRPVRERSVERLCRIADHCLQSTGYDDLSLLSLSTGDYTCLSELMERLMSRCRDDRVAVSLPSVRADALTPQLMAQIKTVRKTGFTIAPEAGTQRLRDVINKNLRYEDVAETVKDAFALGWQVIKLYFMIGLPTETDADLEGVREMVASLKKMTGPVGRRGQINVSITTFVPKAHTPFQWAAQSTLEDARSKMAHVTTRLKMPGVQVKWQSPEMSYLEGVLARGDRRIADVIQRAWALGCVFDGWSDRFKFPLWQQAFEESGLDTHFYISRTRSIEEPLPWAHMDCRVKPDFLKEQWRAAHQLETVGDCRYGNCNACGVCDFEKRKPRVYETCAPAPELPKRINGDEKSAVVELVYSKMGLARLLSHLEVAKVFERALRRAKIPLIFSNGYHPMPRISFGDALPLGMESQAERVRITIESGSGSASVIKRALENELPEGFRIVALHYVDDSKPRTISRKTRYCVLLAENECFRARVEQFKGCLNWPFTRKNRKGHLQRIDLKASVSFVGWTAKNVLEIEIYRNDNGIGIRPVDVLESVLGVSRRHGLGLRVLKLAEHEKHYGLDRNETIDL